MSDRDLAAEVERLTARVKELEAALDRWLPFIVDASDQLQDDGHAALSARIAQAYEELRAVLDQSPTPVCTLCGRAEVEGHTARCSVTKFGVEPVYTPAAPCPRCSGVWRTAICPSCGGSGTTTPKAT